MYCNDWRGGSLGPHPPPHRSPWGGYTPDRWSQTRGGGGGFHWRGGGTLSPADGFRSTEHFKQTIQQSLVELSSQVCVAGQGWPGRTMAPLHPRSPPWLFCLWRESAARPIKKNMSQNSDIFLFLHMLHYLHISKFRKFALVAFLIPFKFGFMFALFHLHLDRTHIILFSCIRVDMTHFC